MIKNIRPEINLLLLCLTAPHDAGAYKQIKSLSSDGIDWQYLVKFASYHKVLFQLYHALSTIPNKSVPDQVISRLRVKVLNSSIRSIYQAKILARIVTLFEDHDIDSIPFKGPILAESLYGNIAARIFSDLDILIQKKDVHKAKKLLIENGYSPEVSLSEKQEAIYLKNEFDYKFFGENGTMVIELHWDMGGRYLNKPLTYSLVRQYCSDADLLNKPVQRISNEFLIVFLSVHASKHVWESIEQVLSIGELIQKNPDWKEIMRIAETLNCTRIVFVSLLIAKKLFDIHLPVWVCDKIRKDSGAKGLCNAIVDKLLNDHPEPPHPAADRFSIFHINIRERFQDKCRFALYLLFNPSRKEWINFPLPAGLSFLHFGLRPVRLLINFVSNRLKRTPTDKDRPD